MKHLVTGAAGFIGSNLVDRLLADGHEVIGVDNFSTGRRRFLEGALRSPKFKLQERDLFDDSALKDLMTGVDSVFHFAANADVRDGLLHPRKDLEQNTIVTSNVLEAMRHAGVKKIGFSSTGSVYGEAKVIPTPEDAPFPIQTSLYGASKLAGEGLISAYAEGYGMQARIFRFVSILGERYTHGHVYDFVKRLQKDPSKLDILGNGKQRKSYLYVGDCVEAILSAMRTETSRRVEIYNLGTDEYTEVNVSVDAISQKLKINPKRVYSGGERGWVGDNPFIFLDCSKIKATGWKASKTIAESVGLTVDYLLANPWVFEENR
jgi:UDP-glucose 4-epimerase